MASELESKSAYDGLEKGVLEHDVSTRMPFRQFWQKPLIREDVEKPPEKTSLCTALKRHFARYWLIYAISIVVFLAIFLPLFFLKIIPAIAQLIVNKASLPIYNGEIKAVSSNTVTISLSTSLTLPAGISARLSPLTLSIYNKDTPGNPEFLAVPIPGQHITGKTNIAISNETVRVTDFPELNKWLRTLLRWDSTAFSVRGTTDAYLGVLRNRITLDKTVNIPALRNLSGAGIADATVLLPPAADGANLVGHLVLPNWSQLTLGLGDNVLDVWAGGVRVAQVDLVDVRLAPGNNTLPFRGRVYVDRVLREFAAVLESQSEALARGKVLLYASGNRTTVSGARISYVEDVLRDARIAVEVPVVRLLSELADSFLRGNATLDGIGELLGDGLVGGTSGGIS